MNGEGRVESCGRRRGAEGCIGDGGQRIAAEGHTRSTQSDSCINILQIYTSVNCVARAHWPHTVHSIGHYVALT